MNILQLLKTRRIDRLVVLVSVTVSVLIPLTPLASLPVHADYTATWWNGSTCDSQHDPGSTQIGIWNGLQDCVGPSSNPDPDIHDNFDNTYTLEWECVDLVMRYLYLAFGVNPYTANGVAVVDNYRTAYGGNLTPLNPSNNQPPEVGDVVSFNAVPGNSAGHTAIVLSSSVNTSGNGAITFLQQNAEPLPSSWSITLSNWNTPSGSGIGSVRNWLHSASLSGTIALTTGVQVTQNQGFIGGSITASYTVSNTGNGPFSLQSLDLLAVDPNGTWVQLGHDTTTSIPANSSITFNHTFYDVGNGDNTAKGGSWGIFAEYTDTNGTYQIPPGSGNGYYVGENDLSRKVTAFNFDSFGSYPVVFFKRGSDGRIYEDDEHPQSPAWWSGWSPLDPQHPQPANEYFVGSFSISPNLATPVPQLAGWVRAADGTIWHESQDTHNVWGGWSEMPTNGAGAAGDIAITINPIGKDFEYYDVGTDGNVWHNYGNFTNYSPVSTQPSGVNFIGNVSAVVTPSTNNEDLFVTDSNSGAWHNNWNPTNGWSGWQQIQPGFWVGGNIATQLNTYNAPEAFVIGHDGQVYQSLAPFTSWTLTYQNPSGVSFVGDIFAQSNLAQTSSINLFVQGSDGNIYQNGWGYQWFAWNKWTSSPVSLNGDPFTIVDAYGSIAWDAMIKGSDGNMWHNWGGWNNWANSGATG